MPEETEPAAQADTPRTDTPPQEGSPGRRLCLVLAGFVAANLILFLCYRLALTACIANDPRAGEVIKALLYGARLDVALLAFELMGVGLVFLAMRSARLKIAFRIFTVLTMLHLLWSFVNLISLWERGQHAGELLVAYIATPKDVYIATSAFIVASPFTCLLALAVMVAVPIMLFRFSRRFDQDHIDLWRPARKRLAIAAIITALLPALAMDAIYVKANRVGKGWRLKCTHARYYTVSGNFAMNQVVNDPCFDLVRIYIPDLLGPSFPDQLEPREALATCHQLLDMKQEREDYPLLREVSSERNLSIRNVIVLQIEGLTQTVLAKKRRGRLVMPFVNSLADEGLYFPRTIQAYNATAGAIFATATSFPKSRLDGDGKEFTNYEQNGHYCSLPHILRKNRYHHYFFQSYRQSSEFMLGFMGNQGYESHGYGELRDKLERQGRLRESMVVQGIFDGPFLDNAAEVLLASPRPLTAHMMTVTTHSPWTLPESFKKTFRKGYANAFNYVDQCVENFMKKINADPDLRDNTLFVLVGDHTSKVFQDGLMERLTVPLIFYGPRVQELRDRWSHRPDILARQIDILPTILDMMGKRALFSGMGKSLLRADSRPRGAISATWKFIYYLQGDFLLRFRLSGYDLELLRIVDGEAILEDVAEEHPEVMARMTREFFAQTQVARKLAREQSVFPRSDLLPEPPEKKPGRPLKNVAP